MNSEVIVLNKERNVTLTAYIQSVGGEFGFDKRPAIIVIPGGGYTFCSDREADPVAMCYAQAGYQTFVLRYTIQRTGRWPMPLQDYEQAMETVTAHADQWHIATDKIAVVGFSAGGHLAACAATIAEHKPAAAILVYAAVLKEIVEICDPTAPSPVESVTSDTCPCFFAAARDDQTVNIRNTIQMELALEKNGVPFESHIYSYGGHGFSTGEQWIVTATVSKRLPHWLPDSVGWLNEIFGQLTCQGFTESKISTSKN